MKSIYSVFLLGVCLAMPAAATAAGPAEAQSPLPAPEITYRSAFADYRPYREEPLGDWRALNDDVTQAGGHIGIMRGDGTAGQHPSDMPPAGSVKSAPAGAHDAHGH